MNSTTHFLLNQGERRTRLEMRVTRWLRHLEQCQTCRAVLGDERDQAWPSKWRKLARRRPKGCPKGRDIGQSVQYAYEESPKQVEWWMHLGRCDVCSDQVERFCSDGIHLGPDASREKLGEDVSWACRRLVGPLEVYPLSGTNTDILRARAELVQRWAVDAKWVGEDKGLNLELARLSAALAKQLRVEADRLERLYDDDWVSDATAANRSDFWRGGQDRPDEPRS